ncbi:MAG: tetratricopeptide repeat-containing diguanylate cyclase [Catonella sp.]|nr:tetratricopeptide repeat-containing diguanylate cyclase [Catonella sp.]
MTNQKNKYDKEIRSLMNRVEAGKFRLFRKDSGTSANIASSKAWEKLCEEELALANERKDDYLKAHASSFLEECFFTNGLISKVMDIHYRTTELLEAAGLLDRLAVSLNDFGLIAAFQGNTSLALENFIKAEAICHKHHYRSIQALVYENMGDMYLDLGDYNKAHSLYSRSIDEYERLGIDPAMASGMARSLCASAFSLLKLDRVDEADDLIKTAEDYGDLSIFSTHILSLLFVKLRRSVANNDGGALFIMDEINSILSNTLVAYHLEAYFADYCKVLADGGFDDRLIKIIELIEKLMSNDIRPMIILSIIPYKIEYYKKTGSVRKYQRALYEYYSYRSLKVNTTERFTRSTLDYANRANVLADEKRRIERSIETLTAESITDPLTGLYNYSKLSEVLEDELDDCEKNGKTLGLSIIDVDFFKQFNDRYGHQAGDEALIAVANALKKCTNSSSMICGRYGGDEFIILFLNMTDDDILTVAENLKKEVKNSGIIHYATKSGKLSISQGIRNSIPQPLNRSWDYLYAADKALYDIKDSLKGGIELVTSYEELAGDKLIGGDDK